MGGKPSKATPADKRLKENKPTQTTPSKQPVIPQKKPQKGK